MKQERIDLPDKRLLGANSAVFSLYILSSLLPVFGILFGYHFLTPRRPVPYGLQDPLLRFAAWDGGQFLQILDQGYFFNPSEMCNASFLPGYPLCAFLIQSLTGCSSVLALLVVAHLCLVSSFLVFYQYLNLRFPGENPLHRWTLCAFAFFPTTFFFRMAYSESLFLLIVLIFCLGVAKEWPIEKLAFLAGLSTLVRVVGVVLTLVVLIRIYKSRGSVLNRLFQGVLAWPVCLWGVIALSAYQGIVLGDFLAFIKAQENYWLRPPTAASDHYIRLAALEPIWSTYIAGSHCYWRNHCAAPILVNLQFANPFFFLGTAFVIGCGIRQNWLNSTEIVIALGLLAISYLGRADEFCMGSQGRYAAAAFPAYIVWGQLFCRLPKLSVFSALACWAGLMSAYSALFSAWYFFV